MSTTSIPFKYVFIVIFGHLKSVHALLIMNWIYAEVNIKNVINAEPLISYFWEHISILCQMET